MKKYNNDFILVISVPLFLLFFLPSCFKQGVYASPKEAATTDSLITIKELKKIHRLGNIERIEREWVVQGVVVGNDEQDNIYKSIFLQDPSGGIMLLLDGQSLYQSYPIGTLIELRVQDLFLSDYRRMIQLVASVDSSSGSLMSTGIASPLFKKHIRILNENVPVVPLLVVAKALHDSLQGRLVKLVDIEFSASDTALQFADKKNKIGASRTIKFCSGGTVYVRTSGYANFAGEPIPNGNGELVGIYAVYNYEKQILLRNPSDILMNKPRCTGAAWLKN